jgi:hypothetical protein
MIEKNTGKKQESDDVSKPETLARAETSRGPVGERLEKPERLQSELCPASPMYKNSFPLPIET